MPEYEHICVAENCKNEWCETYSIKADPPKVCPKCNQETAKRVISGGSGRGIVELSGSEIAAKIKEDVREIKKKAANNENYMANLIGEDRAHKKLLSR